MNENKVQLKDDKTIDLSLQKFNNNIEYINNESKDVIDHLKTFLKKMLKKILKEGDSSFEAKQLQAINSLYITLNKSISDYSDNNMALIAKMLELNDVINGPKEVRTESNDELDEIKNMFASMKSGIDEQDKYLED